MKKKQNIDVSKLSAWLADAVIEHRLEADDKIYVTDLPFKMWLKIDTARNCLVFFTYWTFLEGVSEIDAFRCVNALNSDLMMVQFSADDRIDRLHGHYILALSDGLGRKQILRSARMFAEIFDTAVRHSEWSRLLDPLGDEARPPTITLIG